jgi:hypothetical protein
MLALPYLAVTGRNAPGPTKTRLTKPGPATMLALPCRAEPYRALPCMAVTGRAGTDPAVPYPDARLDLPQPAKPDRSHARTSPTRHSHARP